MLPVAPPPLSPPLPPHLAAGGTEACLPHGGCLRAPYANDPRYCAEGRVVTQKAGQGLPVGAGGQGGRGAGIVNGPSSAIRLDAG